jgi:hypothetical protein
MICKKFEEYISLQIDDELDLRASMELKQHLKNCSSCCQLQADLLAVRRVQLNSEEFDPTAQIWNRIASQLKEEKLIRSQKSWKSWFHWLPAWQFDNHLKPALAGALFTLVLVFSGYFAYKAAFPKPDIDSSTARVLQEINRAETQYTTAIQALEGVSRQRLQTVNPQVARIFQDNLATIDYYLKECKDAIKSEPTNPLAQKYLLAAYQKKVELLETIVNSDLM